MKIHVAFYAMIFTLLVVGCSAPRVGGYTEAKPSDEGTQKAAQFAIGEMAKKDEFPLSLLKIEKAKTQVVAGKNYKLTLKLSKGGKVMRAQAVVLHQPWHKTETYQLTSWQWMP